MSVALLASILLMSILQAGEWARVSTPARHYFSTYIMMSWTSVGSWFVGKWQKVLNCQAVALPNTEEIVLQVFV